MAESGTHRLDALQADLSALVRPLAKTAPGRLPRSVENEPARERFVLSVDRLGWSWDRIAKYLRCTKTTVIAVYHGHRYVSAWMLDALDSVPELELLPTRSRVEQLKKVG